MSWCRPTSPSPVRKSCSPPGARWSASVPAAAGAVTESRKGFFCENRACALRALEKQPFFHRQEKGADQGRCRRALEGRARPGSPAATRKRPARPMTPPWYWTDDGASAPASGWSLSNEMTRRRMDRGAASPGQEAHSGPVRQLRRRQLPPAGRWRGRASAHSCITYSLLCRYFRAAVLPADRELLRRHHGAGQPGSGAPTAARPSVPTGEPGRISAPGVPPCRSAASKRRVGARGIRGRPQIDV